MQSSTGEALVLTAERQKCLVYPAILFPHQGNLRQGLLSLPAPEEKSPPP